MNINDLFSEDLTEAGKRLWERRRNNSCWTGYHREGTKNKSGKTVPNCVPNANENEQLDEIIRKVGDDKYRLYSKKGKNLGTFDSRAGAEKHEREVQYFKHVKESTVTDQEIEEYLAEMRSAGYGV